MIASLKFIMSDVSMGNIFKLKKKKKKSILVLKHIVLWASD